MRSHFRTGSLILALVMVATSPLAIGQSLVQQHGVVVAATGGAVPGLLGSTFGGSGTFDSGVLDASGHMLFRARFTGGTNTLNDRALFYGTGPSDLTILIRGGDPAPGLPGVTLDTGTLQGLGGSPRLNPDGYSMFFSALTGSGVTTLNDSAIFGGPIGGLGVFAREGDAAPGTVGATFNTSFSNLSHQPTGFNSSYRILFQSSLTGGDVSGSTNNAGWFTGVPGSLELMQRKGDVVLGGAVISALGFISQMNASGQVVHDETLSTTLGTLPATASNNATLWIYTPGSGNALVVREGDAAPGTAGATFNVAGNSWFINTGANTFNSSGDCAFNADLLNGDVVAGVNDRAIYVGGVGSLNLAVRRGDAAPGTDGLFGVANNASLNLNNSGQIAFQSTITGGTSTTANDSGIWAGLPGSLALVVREGDLAPGTAGATFASPMSWPMQLSANGQVLFEVDLLGGDAVAGVNGHATYVWDPVLGLQLFLRGNDAIEVAPGVIKNVGSAGGIQFNNGDGSPLSFNAEGWILQRVTMVDSTSAIIKTRIGSFTGTPATISQAAGGAHMLQLNAGAVHAGQLYAVVGSASGTLPGTPIGAFTIPLNIDFYTDLTLTLANMGPFFNTLGNLDANGRATAAIVIPPAITGIAGIAVHHAYGVLDAFNNLVFVSEAARLEITP